MTTDAAARTAPLVPLARALALWLDGVGPVAPVARAPREAIGRVLADPLRAPADVPSAALARRAGHAVAAADTIGASPYAPAFAGSPPPLVAAGAALPSGCDAILPIGAVADGPLPEILAEVAPGTDVRRAGSEARAGAILRAEGARLRALDAAIAQAAGLERVRVREPIVALDGAAQAAVAPLVAALGGRVADIGAPADLAIRIGAAREGDTILAAGLALSPGEDAALGRDAAGVPLLVLPALASDAIGAGLALLPEALARLSGGALATRSGILAEGLSSRGGMAEVALLAKGALGLVPIAVGDTPLAALARADAFLVVPADLEGFARGAAIAYLPVP